MPKSVIVEPADLLVGLVGDEAQPMESLRNDVLGLLADRLPGDPWFDHRERRFLSIQDDLVDLALCGLNTPLTG